MHWIATYAKEIGEIAARDGTEHSYRTPIENMLRAAAAEFGGAAEILQEPSRAPNIGAPDFRIGARSGGVIGYLECKPPGADLKKLGSASQIKKYQTLSGNILLTDCWRWLLFKDGTVVNDLTLPEKPGREAKTQFTELLRRFLTTEAEKIGDAERLAAVLARRCALLREGLETHANDATGTRLPGLLNAFRTALDTELDFPRFADAFAQTLVYSLLLAKLKAPAGNKLDLYNISRHIPNNFAVIREITVFVQELDANNYADLRWVVDDILATINAMDAAAVAESMSYKNGGRGFADADDPYIYFYENFLAAYDAKLRKQRGVYYTPPPVVKFIVRAVDDLLRRDFGLPDGLAETGAVTALDFAAGTGTFMLEMFRTVLSGASPARRDLLVREHILKNFYGFELLMAPYAIAHLKLSQFLADNDVPLEQDERINIFLTNTLEQISETVQIPMMPKLAEEANRAQKVKDSPVLVITGNPPYSGHSQNTGEWITNLIETYKYVDGEHFGERRHWLHDDYVKFIRFAQWKMEKVERGIVAIITNHAFLDNPTFRGMRKSLLDTFDGLYFLDLHGNSKKKETTPEGGKDKNVFDIQQGVAISLLVKNPETNNKGVFHADLYGKRSEKDKACATDSVETVKWKKLKPKSPSYFFVPKAKMPVAYKNSFSITEIFSANVSGIVTARDPFAIDINKNTLLQRMRRFINFSRSNSQIAEELNLKDTRGWKIGESRKEMAKIENLSECCKEITYRPFDTRWIFYHSSAVDWGREKFMRHMLAGENIGLCISKRQEISGEWRHVFISDQIVQHHTATAKEVNYLFPLYRYDTAIGTTTRTENLNLDFRRWIDDHYGVAVAHTPEAILGCIYAILHSPDYRNRYADFLRTDFPRIPFPKDNDEFNRLATIGQQLIAAHLLRDHHTGPLANHQGEGDHKVEQVRYDEKTERLYFNPTEYFAPVPPQVFNFQIGGYQPLDKYLKSRKAQTLTLHDTTTIQKTTNAIAFTLEKMAEIDR